MMYYMKNINNHDDHITLPDCMYRIKNPNEITIADDINIKNQVKKFIKAPSTKMAELEKRQDQLLKKLDILYERIKTISSYCTQSSVVISDKPNQTKQGISTPDEIVVDVSSDNLPWFINMFLKESSCAVSVSWHIHSSVPNAKIQKINAFIKKLKKTENHPNINLRLIFTNGSADSVLKLSPLAVPIIGNVNILRYLACVCPNILPYNSEDYYVDSLLDLCHQLERVSEKSRDSIIKKLFKESNDWIYDNKFSIVDVALFNIIKQWQNGAKYVPKGWFQKCEMKCL